jgi:hypothetical protein
MFSDMECKFALREKNYKIYENQDAIIANCQEETLKIKPMLA